MKQLLLSLTIIFLCSFQQPAAVTVQGFYSNEKSTDGEHSIGYSLHLWQYKGSLIGTVSYNEGLIGDQVDELISNVVYNKASGDLSFTSTLNGQKLSFKGKLSRNMVTGTFSLDNKPGKNQTLKSCCKDAFIYKNYKSYKDWEQQLQELI